MNVSKCTCTQHTSEMWVLYHVKGLWFVICEQAREATMAVQGKMVDFQRKKSKGQYFSGLWKHALSEL
jgi:hypothetical protein